MKKASVFYFILCAQTCFGCSAFQNNRAQEVFDLVKKYDQCKAQDYAELVDQVSQEKPPQSHKQNAKLITLKKMIHEILTGEPTHAVLYLVAALCARAATSTQGVSQSEAIWKSFIVLMIAEKSWEDFVHKNDTKQFDFFKILEGPNFIYHSQRFLQVAGLALPFGSRMFFVHDGDDRAEKYTAKSLESRCKGVTPRITKPMPWEIVGPKDLEAASEEATITPRGTGLKAWMRGSRLKPS